MDPCGGSWRIQVVDPGEYQWWIQMDEVDPGESTSILVDPGCGSCWIQVLELADPQGGSWYIPFVDPGGSKWWILVDPGGFQ